MQYSRSICKSNRLLLNFCSIVVEFVGKGSEFYQKIVSSCYTTALF